MKSYTRVSRKTVGEDRIAICPKFGCAQMTRVKPLRYRFIGFGKYPKCKLHHIPLVYTDERIGDIVDAALACFFDISALPSKNLIDEVKSRFLNEFESFLKGWIYCITIGRGALIISRYMDSISNAYLKQLTNNQMKRLKKDKLLSKAVEDTIKNGMDEISTQYTRILTHLRTHSEIFVESEKLNPLSENLRKYLYNWQNSMVKNNEILNSPEGKYHNSLEIIKSNYDSILNVKICRSLIGLDPEIKEVKKAQLTAFDIFSAYNEFYAKGLTLKFTKLDISHIILEERTTINFTKKDLLDINHKRKIWIEIINKSRTELYLEDVFDLLKQKNPNITKEFLSSFLRGNKYSSYSKGARMPYKRFLRLRTYINDNILREDLFNLYCHHLGNAQDFEINLIPYKIFLTTKDSIPYTPLSKNSDTAELLTIMLGDGHLNSADKDKVVQISLNIIDEERYFEYVGRLLKKVFPDSEFRIKDNQGKGTDWITTNSRIHFEISELGKGIKKTGLIPGDKVKNQVSVPEWILSDISYVKRGLKGLFDTDGSISISRKSQFFLTFSNSSKNLINDFYFMCRRIGLKKISNAIDIGHDTWRIAINDSYEIKQFLFLVKPEKFQEPYRRLWLALNIIYKRAPESIQKKVREYSKKWKENNKKYFSYSKENAELLKDWIEDIFINLKVNYVFGCKFNYQINKKMIKYALRIGLLSQYECISYSLQNSNQYRIHWLPEKLRNDLIKFIYRNLNYNTNQIISLFLEYLVSNSKLMSEINPFNDSDYNIALKNYLESMILVIKEIERYRTENGNIIGIGHYSIESYFKDKGIKLAFSRRIIKKIIDSLGSLILLPSLK